MTADLPGVGDSTSGRAGRLPLGCHPAGCATGCLEGCGPLAWLARFNRFLRRLYTSVVATAEVTAPGPSRLGIPLRPLRTGLRPVVLVPGFANSPKVMRRWERSLRDDGFPVRVFVDPRRGTGDLVEAAERLGKLVDEVRTARGADRVDIVGYSAGGVVSRVYVSLLGGAANIGTLVTIGSPHHGSAELEAQEFVLQRIPKAARAVAAALPEAQRQLAPGSELLVRLNAQPVAPSGIRVVSIYAWGGDGVIRPANSPHLDGARNVPLATGQRLLPHRRGRGQAGPDHLSLIIASHEAFETARRELLAGQSGAG